LLVTYNDQIVALAVRHAIPAMYILREIDGGRFF
jgi:hypothetical protein